MGASARTTPRVKHANGSTAGRRNGHASSDPQAGSPVAVAAATEEPRALHVAILDRDSGFLVVLAKRLESQGWKHTVLPTRISTKTLAAMEIDALIIDLALLGAQRWKWLGRLCRERPDLAVVICAGSSTVAERVCGLRLGADGWLSKPCHPEELIARVEAVTSHRRRPESRSLDPVQIGEVEIRPDQFQAFVHDRSLRLTRREYQLIELLSRAGNEVLPRETIYECLWGASMIRNDRSVDVFVHKLRRKLECASPGWRYIHTQFGVGYRLAAEAADAPQHIHELAGSEGGEESAVECLVAA
jgi:DNA-binding response OmpR family regulator